MINFSTGPFEELIGQMEAQKFQNILLEIERVERLEGGEPIADLNLVAANLGLTIEEVGRFFGIDQHGNIMPTELGQMCMMTLGIMTMVQQNN